MRIDPVARIQASFFYAKQQSFNSTYKPVMEKEKNSNKSEFQAILDAKIKEMVKK